MFQAIPPEYAAEFTPAKVAAGVAFSVFATVLIGTLVYLYSRGKLKLGKKLEERRERELTRLREHRSRRVLGKVKVKVGVCFAIFSAILSDIHLHVYFSDGRHSYLAWLSAGYCIAGFAVLMLSLSDAILIASAESDLASDDDDEMSQKMMAAIEQSNASSKRMDEMTVMAEKKVAESEVLLELAKRKLLQESAREPNAATS